MKVLHSWLKDYIGENIPPAKVIADTFTFHAFEVEEVIPVGDDTVIDVKVLPDRSSDCLSHRGVARELAALMDTPLIADPFLVPRELSPVDESLRITIAEDAGCRRFTLARVTGVTIAPSPAWLKTRLEALGQRSINNVVDATNYVMLGLGQPLHAYDAEKFPHKDAVWHFVVRRAKDGETITTLSKEDFTLTPQIQLIAEASTGAPAGIAGIKGGALAEIHGGTKDLILEAANFDPQITRKASQHLRLQTDASKRFENNLSSELAPIALTELVALITQIAGGTCVGYADMVKETRENAPVSVTLARINSLLGMTLTAEIVEDIFARLGFAFTPEADGWSVTAPWERTDLSIAEDVIADVGRVYGYEHVTSVLPTTSSLSECNPYQYYSERIRQILITAGASEVITSSFRKSDTIELQNALASDKGCLRSSLRLNIKEVLDKNMPLADLLGLRAVQVFEIGTVFHKSETDDGIAEHRALAIGVRVKQQGVTPKDDGEVRILVEKLEHELGTTLQGELKEGVFECDLSTLVAVLPAPHAYIPFVSRGDTAFVPYSAYPFVSRDIALWTKEGTSAHEVESSIREHAGVLLTRATLFDEFTKEGRTSYAFRLVFQSCERTLNDDEVGEIMGMLTTALTGKGFEIR